MLKKLVSVVIVVFMSLSSYVTILANDSLQFSISDVDRLTSSGLEKETKTRVFNEVETIDGFVQASQYLVGIDVDNEDFVYFYKLDAGNSEVVSQVTFKEHENGNIELNVVEGELKNQILYTDSGKMYIDGEEVIIENEKVPVDSARQGESNLILPRDRTIYTTDECPYGVQDDYSDYVLTVKKSSLYLSNSLENITNFALAGIIGLVDGWYGVTLGVVALLKSELEAYEPQTRYLSTIADHYHHYNGERIPNGMFVTQVDSSWFTKANYLGTEVFSIVYNCKEYY